MNALWNLTGTFNYTALILAASKGYKEIVELLIKQEGIDINIQDILNKKKFIMFKSNFFDYIEQLNYLWNLIRTFNYTALIYAASKGYREIVELLIRQEGTDINIQDIFNQKHSSYSNLSFLIALNN